MVKRTASTLLLLLFLVAFHAGAEETSVKIAILPWKVHAEPRYAYIGEALQDMLSTRIGSHHGVELVRKDVINERLPEGTEVTEGVAEKVGKGMGAGYVLFGSLSILGDHISIDAKLLDVNKGKLLPIYRKSKGVGTVVDIADTMAEDVLKAIGVWEEPVKTETPVYKGKFRAAYEEEPEKADLPEEKPREPARKGIGLEFINAVDVAMDVKEIELYDLTGDGKKELVALTEQRLVVFSIKDKAVEKLAEIDTGGGNISVDVADGVLYLSRLGRSAPDSCIVWYDKGFKKKCGIPYLLRVLYQDGTPVILGQDFRREWGYRGGIFLLERKGEGLEKKEALRLPRRIALYGFEVCKLTEDTPPALLWLDRKGYLRVYTSTADKEGFTERWRSSIMYGGTLNWVELEERDEYILFESRFYCADVDGDGIKEVVIKKNTAGGIFGEWASIKKFFKNGSIRILEWHGVSFSEEWKSDELTPYVADFVIGELNGVKTLVVVTSEKGRFAGKEKSSILFYKFDL